MSAEEQELRISLMAVAEQLRPIHEFVAGELAYFIRQGFTLEQAHAMAAAEFTSVFGLRIANSATGAEDG
jgi:hypothetical protein